MEEQQIPTHVYHGMPQHSRCAHGCHKLWWRDLTASDGHKPNILPDCLKLASDGSGWLCHDDDEEESLAPSPPLLSYH